MKFCANCIEEKISVIPRKLLDGRTVNLCGKCANSGKMLLEIYEEEADNAVKQKHRGGIWNSGDVEGLN